MLPPMTVADEIAVVVEIGEVGTGTLRIFAGEVIELASKMLRRLRALFFRLDLSPLTPLSPLGIGRSLF
jgi:hypothetical protein